MPVPDCRGGPALRRAPKASTGNSTPWASSAASPAGSRLWETISTTSCFPDIRFFNSLKCQITLKWDPDWTHDGLLEKPLGTC